MYVVGVEQAEWQDDHVHTIDIWYSQRRRCWIVERLNVDGHLVGAAHQCTTLEDAEDCLWEWLRSHSEAHVTSVHEVESARERRRGTQAAEAGHLARTNQFARAGRPRRAA